MRNPALTALSLTGALLASACAAPDLGPKPVAKIVGSAATFRGPDRRLAHRKTGGLSMAILS
jgi:hypothetical protein